MSDMINTLKLFAESTLAGKAQCTLNYEDGSQVIITYKSPK